MNNPFSNERPIYLQIVDRIKVKIITKEYAAGDKLPSVREMASLMQVNPNTMQRAFSILESEGIVRSHRTSGRYVDLDEAKIAKLRKDLAREQTEAFLASMEQMGFTMDGKVLRPARVIVGQHAEG